MSISIVSCPKCGTFLLSETAQCHRCRYVIHPDRAVQFRDTALPTDAAIQQDSERCKQCGETYRKGLVRCWSCGAFTRSDIEEAYYRLLQGHGRAISVAGEKYELPEITELEARKRFLADDDPGAPVNANQTMEFTAMDEDFELSGNLQLVEDNLPYTNGATESETPELGAAMPTASSDPKPEPLPTASITARKVNVAAPPPDETESLMDAAKQQETDIQKARRAKLGEGFVIYCPMGCKIRVQDRHRGKVGRCPKCQSTFVVPMAAQTSVSGAVPASAGESAAGQTPGQSAASEKFSRWIHDVHLHRVAPQKLRIKADSLLKDFQEVDVGFDASGVLLVGLPAAGGGGMFAKKGVNKKDAARTAVVDHLKSKGTSEGVPSTFKQEFARDTIRQFALSQPTPPEAESLWGDIAVFGTGRIAVRLPKFDDKTSAYLSFSLSEFREFSKLLAEYFGIRSFGEGCGIPLKDEYKTDGCHITKNPIKDLQNLVYYQKDPTFKLEIAGYRCKTCGAVIGEVARAAQKLGGANAKGIAKVKCPKCTKPLGNQPLYHVAATPTPNSVSEDESASTEETAAAEQTPAATEPATA